MPKLQKASKVVLRASLALLAAACAPTTAWATNEPLRPSVATVVNISAAPIDETSSASAPAGEYGLGKYHDEAYMAATFDKYDPELKNNRRIVQEGPAEYYEGELAFLTVAGIEDAEVNEIVEALDVWIVEVMGDQSFGLLVAVRLADWSEAEEVKERLKGDARVSAAGRSNAPPRIEPPGLMGGYTFAGIATLSSVSAPGRVLDVQWGSGQPGAPLQLFDANATAAQRFRLLAVPNTGCYSLVNVGSGLALDVPGGDAWPGAALWQHPPNGTDAQLFALEPDGEGAYVIHPRLDPALALDLRWGGTGNGTALQLWESNGTDAQRFRLDISAPSVPSGTYALTSALGTALDAAGNGGAPGTNVQAWGRQRHHGPGLHAQL